jgi:Na+/melibiose symporter-like transporter
MKADLSRGILPDGVGYKPKVHHDRLTIWNKLAFACCGPPYQLTATAIGFFFGTVFLLEVARLPPMYVSVVVLVGRFWDAITDPIVGHLVNLTQSRKPSLRLWVICCAPFLVVSYMSLWYVPPFGVNGKLAYYMICYMAFQTSLTCLNVPSNTLIMYITHHQSDRDSATALKMTVEVMCVVLSALIQNLTLGFLSKSQKEDCEVLDTTGMNGTGAARDESAPPMVISDQVVNSWKLSYMVASCVIGFCSFLSILVFFFGTNERKNYSYKEKSETEESKNADTFRGGFKRILSYRPFQILTFSYMFLALSLQLIQTNFVLYLKTVLLFTDSYHYLLIALLSTAFLAIPLWQKLLSRLSKRNSLTIGNLLLLVPTLAMFLVPVGTSYVFVLGMAVVAGVAIGNAYLLPWSMLPDVIADYHRATGSRHDGLFYGVYVFFTKFAVGIAQGLSQIVLHIVGYNNGACYQNDATSVALRFLISPVPIVMLLISCAILRFYQLNFPSCDDAFLDTDCSDKGVQIAKEAGIGDASSSESIPRGLPPGYHSSCDSTV